MPIAVSQPDGEMLGGPNVTRASANTTPGTTSRPSAYQPMFVRKRVTRWRRSRRPCLPSTMLVITTIGSSSPSHVLAMMKGSIDHSTSMVRWAISGMRAIAQPTGKNHARNAAIGCLRTNSVTFIVPSP